MRTTIPIHQLLRLGLLLTGLVACKPDLLDTRSYSQIQQENFWKTAQDGTQGLNAIYNALLSEDAFGLFMFNDVITPIACSSDGNPTGVTAFNNPNANAQNAMAIQRWRGYYQGVYRANLALEKLPGITANESVRNRLIGEAKFLRALNYLYLVQHFGDVPLLLNTLNLTEAQSPQVTRSPAAQVYAQLYKDLDEAYAVLPTTYPTTDAGRATKYAARALKGRALLYEGKYAEAAAALKDVMNSRSYSLYPNYFNLFNYRFENNAEVIFDVQYSNVTGTGVGNRFEKYTGNRESASSGWTWMNPTVTLIDNYEMTDGLPYDKSPLFDAKKPYDNRDPRMDFTLIRPGALYRSKDQTVTTSTDARFIRYDQKSDNRRSGFLVRKAVCDDATGVAYDSPTNLILLRYADVLLMYAEAQNESSGPDASVYDAVNLVRQRPGVGMPALKPGKSQAEMREVVRHERVVELALEGHYYFDLKRWKLWDKVDLKVKRPVSDADYLNRADAQPNRIVFSHYYLLPIPQSELDKNPKLTQNNGY